MANGLSLMGDSTNTGVFDCPNCKQTINVTLTQCTYCGVAIDASVAEIAAVKMARQNNACSDASFLRTCALAMPVFWLLMLVPFVSMLGVCGYFFLLFAIPFLSIRWWVKYANVELSDSDTRRARTTVVVISVLILLPWGLELLRLLTLHSN